MTRTNHSVASEGEREKFSFIFAFSVGQVTITILDENDNSPQFDITSDSSVSVAEDSSIGQRIALVLARDPDAGSNGQVAMLL